MECPEFADKSVASDCTDGFHVDSVCRFSCPAGYRSPTDEGRHFRCLLADQSDGAGEWEEEEAQAVPCQRTSFARATL